MREQPRDKERLEDIVEGRIYKAESVDDLFKQILGDDYVSRSIRGKNQ